jgi:3-deoxy-D-manno-octulosonate 8-phosphate phosphatase (KDO 8-P phosphatase)
VTVPASAAGVRLLCLDVDGVLTDGSVFLDGDGRESKLFNVRDGLGISLWQRMGGRVAIVTGRPAGAALRTRAEELHIEHLLASCADKAAGLLNVAAACGVQPGEVAFVGDDLPDIPAMRACGYPVAVADAAPEVRSVAAFVTSARGGRGAVREVVEQLLRVQNRWSQALSMFDAPHAAGARGDRPRST